MKPDIPRTERRTAGEARREAILEAALWAFADKGFTETSNVDLARVAGLKSPALIYHYFPTKLDLLRATFERFAPPFQVLATSEQLKALPLRDALRLIAKRYMETASEPRALAVFRLALSEATRNPELQTMFAGIGPQRLLEFITQLMASAVDRGEIKPFDPQLAARMFIGPFISMILGSAVLGMKIHERSSFDETIEAALDGFFFGLGTSGAKP